jgi:hypothetical protein
MSMNFIVEICLGKSNKIVSYEAPGVKYEITVKERYAVEKGKVRDVWVKRIQSGCYTWFDATSAKSSSKYLFLSLNENSNHSYRHPVCPKFTTDPAGHVEQTEEKPVLYVPGAHFTHIHEVTVLEAL